MDARYKTFNSLDLLQAGNVDEQKSGNLLELLEGGCTASDGSANLAVLPANPCNSTIPISDSISLSY